MKHQSFQKGIAVKNAEFKRHVNKKEMGSKSRIKQGSLSAIFAKKLKDTNTVAHKVLQHSPISSQAKNTTPKVTEVKTIKQFDTIDKVSLKSGKISSIASSDITNEPMISFIKPTKEHIGKTLAKKRNVSGNEQKKSLSDIFSSQVKNQTQLNINTIQKYNIDKSSVQNREPKIITKELLTSEDKRESIEKDRQEEKARNKKIVKKHREQIINGDRESDKTPRLSHRAGGMISSLFGNNPDIPTIGQRLVKPVNEPIFTEITFEDLNIHPFMVSLFYIYVIHLWSKNIYLLSVNNFLSQISNLAQNMNITKMTTVQQKAIPQIFSAKDILIRSQTGSGKTLAYAIPIVESLHKIRPKLSRNCRLSALIVVPTRELSLQTYECFIKLVKVSQRNISWIYYSILCTGIYTYQNYTLQFL